MYKVIKTGYILGNAAYHRLLKKVLQITYESKLWKIWRAVITPGTCYNCASMNGRILSVDDPPVHPNCNAM